MKITLSAAKSIEENAAVYFDRAKKNAKKILGAQETIEKKRKELNILKKKQATEIAKIEEHTRLKNRKKEWYEKFRWFLTSSGKLVIGGRDATSNEIIIKKHTQKQDLVFHTDIAGSPFFVLQGSDPKSIEEVASATASFSRAWKIGVSSTPVFYVKPEQVTKKAQSGEFLTKGAFMIRGETQYVENHVELGIGIFEDKVFCGPLSAVKKYCTTYAHLVQGDTKPSDIAKKLKKTFQATADDIVRALPSGGCKIKKLITA